MPKRDFTHSLQLPELKIVTSFRVNKNTSEFRLLKTSEMEVCPKCASPSKTIYDHVYVTIKDTPIRDRRIFLSIKKRRFFCKSCKKPFIEPVAGIKKGFRTTDRFRRHILWCADNFANLHEVEKQLEISSWPVHTAYYEQLELQLRKLQNSREQQPELMIMLFEEIRKEAIVTSPRSSLNTLTKEYERLSLEDHLESYWPKKG